MATSVYAQSAHRWPTQWLFLATIFAFEFGDVAFFIWGGVLNHAIQLGARNSTLWVSSYKWWSIELTVGQGACRLWVVIGSWYWQTLRKKWLLKRCMKISRCWWSGHRNRQLRQLMSTIDNIMIIRPYRCARVSVGWIVININFPSFSRTTNR